MRRHTFFTLTLSAFAACAPAEEENPGSGMRSPDEADVSSELTTRFDIHRLLEDDELTGGGNISTRMIQEYLTQKGSFLARYSDPTWGLTAAELIVQRSRAYGVSPLYMLARIQTESSLIQSGTSSKLEQATGCACPDGSGCAAVWRGFGNQIECSARKLRGYLDDLDADGTTVTGWQVGVSRRTGDPCVVTPANKATAALYTYTPWVGAYGIQCRVRTDIGGSTLVSLAYARFASEYDWSQGTTASSCRSGTVEREIENGGCVQSASDAVWRQCRDGVWTLHREGTSPACTVSWGWCTSGTLGRDVPARTCVQARWDQRWYQCGEGARFVLAADAASTGTGPVGPCAELHALGQ
jgi:hypothetical protein